jgi:hypothetical protein
MSNCGRRLLGYACIDNIGQANSRQAPCANMRILLRAVSGTAQFKAIDSVVYASTLCAEMQKDALGPINDLESVSINKTAARLVAARSTT